MPERKNNNLYRELKRRNVFRVAITYLAASWLFIEVADTILPKLPEVFSDPDGAIRTIFILVAIGFVPLLIFSWFFELTAGGFVRDSEVEHDVARSAQAGRRFDFAIIGLLSVALIYFVSTHNWSEQGPTDAAGYPDKSVAVLPFVNMSGDPDNDYLSDGITETLLHALAQLPELKVPARTSSFFFKGQNIDVREIARQLGVSTILEGSIQRNGDTIRVVAQLTEAETGYHLWSKTFDREMSDIFAVQDEIANSVALAMKVTFAGDTGQGVGNVETIGTDNVAAYETYLKGLQQRNTGSVKSLILSEILFKEALALDPDFYEALLGLANTYWNQFANGEITEVEARAHVRPILDRLREERADDIFRLRLDIRLRHIFGRDMENYLARITASIAEMPSEAQLYQEMVLGLRFLGRSGEAMEWLNRGIGVDPLNWNLHYMRARWLERLSDLDGAEAAYAKAIELNPGNSAIYSMAANIHWARQEYGQAFTLERNAMKADPLDYEVPADIAILLYQFGLFDEGDKYLQRASMFAPDKPYVRVASLYQVLLRDDHSRARGISKKMLLDDIENRFDAYSLAAMVFVSVMIESGEGEKALAVLEELHNGVLSPAIHPDNKKDWALQYYAALALASARSKEDTINLLDSLEPEWDDSFPRWRKDSGAVAVIELVRDNIEQAVLLALENLEGRPGREYLLYRHIYWYKELAKEPAVAERLRELDAEIKQAGEVIGEYIVRHDLQL